MTNGFDDKITVEATFPGGFNLGQGAVIPGVDFQIWPMFQALDLDVILTCIEVGQRGGAMSLAKTLECRTWAGCVSDSG